MFNLDLQVVLVCGHWANHFKHVARFKGFVSFKNVVPDVSFNLPGTISQMQLEDFYAIVKGAAELVASGRWRAVRECASDTCTWMFLDTSKNHSRRWCEMARCGNRDKVQRFRARSRRARPRKAIPL